MIRPSPAPASTTGDRIRRTFWVGLVAVVVYVLLAAGLANLLDLLVQPASVEGEFALSHLVPLPIAIAAGLAFARLSGWWGDIWSQQAEYASPPRRLWMLAIPLLLLINPLLGLVGMPWGERSGWFVLLLLVGCAMIGLGEELFYRGILRVSLRSHHGELVALLVTSLLFGLSHSLGSMLHGVPAGTIAFQVGATAVDGALYYAAFRATGTLWVPIAVHALTDFSLYAQAGGTDAASGHASSFDSTPVIATTQFVLWGLLIAVIVVFARDDATERKRRRAEQGASTV
ncbi:CPBP family intramembrane glutamic endopeptidase [Agromyces sp. NPDC056965]|uniref:CPBP family intramembrane glutamic endopeptidase n=1 Tax=Agromyces sp. NPDC056965 TaxID=3345983 RepID=UPI00362AA814